MRRQSGRHSALFLLSLVCVHRTGHDPIDDNGRKMTKDQPGYAGCRLSSTAVNTEQQRRERHRLESFEDDVGDDEKDARVALCFLPITILHNQSWEGCLPPGIRALCKTRDRERPRSLPFVFFFSVSSRSLAPFYFIFQSLCGVSSRAKRIADIIKPKHRNPLREMEMGNKKT